MILSTAFPPEEGIGFFVYNLSKKLIAKGHNVTVVTRGGLRGIQHVQLDGITVLRAPFIPLYPFHVEVFKIFASSLLRRIRGKFEILHIQSPLSPPINVGVPIMATFHTPVLVGSRFVELIDPLSVAIKMQRYASYRVEMGLIKSAKIITTVSKSIAQALKEYRLDPKRIRVIGNGVDEKLFKPSKPSDNQYFLCAGRLSHRKGLFDLLQAAAHVCNRNSTVKFLIAGKGPLANKLLSQTRALGLEERVKFLGFVPREKLIKLYQECTLYVSPSHYEGLPTNILEAMSCGAAVIATAVSGNVDVISESKNGILVPPKNPKVLAEAILRLLEKENYRKELGREARMTIESNYTWDSVCKRVEEAYKDILEGYPGGGSIVEMGE